LKEGPRLPAPVERKLETTLTEEFKTALMRAKRVAGFQTGDMVRAVMQAGKKAGTNVVRVAIRASKKLNIQSAGGVVQGIHAKHCELLARGDGYGYGLTRELLSAPGLKSGVSRSPI